ncbi:MAG: amidophosphoribosyltransferase [Candidatus Omnitrophica bacterium]|nr:amidophosphoribosyltransferase [Candidatus Omnitrophota bacterium]
MSGLFGVVSKTNCIEDLFYGTDYCTHMGTEFGGMAVLEPMPSDSRIIRKIRNISQGQFKSKFIDDYKELNGKYGIGVISDKDEQPIFLNTKFGPIAICSAGLIENHAELIQKLHREGVSFSETSEGHSNSTEIVGKLITQGDSLLDGITKMFSVIQGSSTLLILTRDGVYAARDRYGYVPLTIGKRGGDFAIASETDSFANLDFKIEKLIEPGEIVLLNNKGMQTVEHMDSGASQICTFLWIYTGFPASSYEGVSAERARERCGSFLAKRDTVKADLASGVPDSGTAHAIGYAMEAKIPFRRPLVKYTPGYGRSYTPPTQEIRDKVARMKLIPIKDVIDGNSIVVCEDSIVRGTQLKNFTVQKFWDNGAKELHVRPACPPLMYPCRFCLSTRSIDELAARKAIKELEGEDIEDVSEYMDEKTDKYKKMVEWIRKDLGVTTLQYQRLEDMIEAIGIPQEKLCLYCWNGKCPTGNIDADQKKTLKKSDVLTEMVV